MELNKTEVQTPNKPSFYLADETEPAGNAFAIMGAATIAARKAGWTKKQIDAVLEEAMSGDYYHLRDTMMEYFDCDDEDDEEDDEDNDYYEDDMYGDVSADE